MSAPLKGIAWRHTRAMAPLQALSWVLDDAEGGRPMVEWETRSLKSFAEDALDVAGAGYDLIVFDYPFAGEALAEGWLTPLDDLLPAPLLAARRNAFVGRQYDSFVWDGCVAALPLDAACYVRAWRPDRLEALGEALPQDWDQTIAFAERGHVITPLTPTAVWGGVISLCAGRGETPLRPGGPAFPRAAALRAFDDLKRLVRHVPDWCFSASPVIVLNRLSRTDDFAYCPMTYGYSTYGMTGYAPHRLSFGDIAVDPGRPGAGAILGGAGIGVLATSTRPKEAAELAAWLTSDSVQSNLYAQFGGQPAAVAAWDDAMQDRIAGGFYSATRKGMDGCYHRPNGPGFHAFQTRSVNRLHAAMKDCGAPEPVFDAIERDWEASFA